ncbi:MAG: hypothetical protein HY964_03150 [Ignavibacteriales bacterium]|nr:hypothetical protein [Ignavibacteriales bacterium]
MEGFIVVATYLNEIDAELAQATLAASGIEAYLRYEDTGHMMPVLQQTEGVKLLVVPENYDEAKLILTTSPNIMES